MYDNRTNQPMTICSWCETVLNEGTGPISHGICDECLPRLLQTVLRTESPSLNQARGARIATL